MKELLALLKQNGKECTGCGACYNVCPVNAIEMVPNPQGFRYPRISGGMCINCNLCEKTCPKLNSFSGNADEPHCYAARANDEIRKESSSGGIFTLLAQYVLSQHGVVCGAAMEDDYSIHHICIEREEELKKLRKSKYVQSDTEKIYIEVQHYLEQCRYVLFTGCPCQVAAMRNIAGDSEYLYCVDILCHGVPSEQMWKDYLKENFNLSKVENVEFRSKLNGWRADQLRVFWKDGTSDSIPWTESAYEEGFQRNISLRDGCEDCEFAGHKRQGDLTIGDFWRVEEYDETLNDKKGTSVILVNSVRGDSLLNRIRDQFIDLQETPIHAARFNRIETKFASHPQKERFKTLYPGHSYSQAVMQCRHALYDIGVVGLFAVKNFGGQLTQYALYRALTDWGYSVLMIECPTNSKYPPSPRGPYLFAERPYPDYSLSRYYSNIAEMKFLNKQCKTFITGSDQMFNNNTYNNHAKFMTLNFVTDNHRKIAYAASWGHDCIWGEEADRGEESYYIKKFDAFSVREDSAVKLAKEKFGVEAVHVLDPVFLCPVSEYQRMIEIGEKQVPTESFLFSYILDVSSEKEEILKKCVQNTDLEIYALLDEDPEKNTQNIQDIWSIETLQNARIEIWIAYIAKCKVMITDSFHGMCLAIILHKEFIAVINKMRGETRFTSLLHMLHLEDRMVYSMQELESRYRNLPPIDYVKVDEILNREREKSKQWLCVAIEEDKEKCKSMTSFDILDGRLDEVCKQTDEKYDSLVKRCNEMEQRYLSQLHAVYNSKTWRAGSAITYLPRKVKNRLKRKK